MRADAHYVEQLDGAAPTVAVQHIAVHAIDVSDAPADASTELVESIKRYGVLEPLVVQRNDGTYKPITGHKRLAAARAAGLRDVPCLVHHVSDDRAQTLRAALQPVKSEPVHAATQSPAQLALVAGSILDIAVAAMRLLAATPDGQVSVVKTAVGPRLTIDLPFDV